MAKRKSLVPGALGLVVAGFVALAGVGAPAAPPAPPPVLPTYADLADPADSAPVVLRARVRKVAAVEAARAGGIAPGRGRFYIEAQTEALYFGTTTMGEKLRYLVDLPLDARGKPPRLGKQSVILFARSVAGRPGELQLITPDSQVFWHPATEAQLRGIITEFNAPGAPAKVSTVREAIHVPGTLAGQGETQLFLATPGGEPASITVRREPGQTAQISVSFSEVVESAAGLPPANSLAWYRLACFLPGVLPPRSNLSEGEQARAIAERDYRVLMDRLGACPRTRR